MGNMLGGCSCAVWSVPGWLHTILQNLGAWRNSSPQFDRWHAVGKASLPTLQTIHEHLHSPARCNDCSRVSNAADTTVAAMNVHEASGAFTAALSFVRNVTFVALQAQPLRLEIQFLIF